MKIIISYNKSTKNHTIFSAKRSALYVSCSKPEPLKHSKVCSRRITDEHRLVYNMDSNQNLIIYSCKYHYEKQRQKKVLLFCEFLRVRILTIIRTFLC